VSPRLKIKKLEENLLVNPPDIFYKFYSLQWIDRSGLLWTSLDLIPFTWSNKRQENQNIRERLDRSLANRDRLSLFRNASSHYSVGSQLALLFFSLEVEGSYSHLPQPFRFEAFWTMDYSRQSRGNCNSLEGNLQRIPCLHHSMSEMEIY
jgi:hypothetical protein